MPNSRPAPPTVRLRDATPADVELLRHWDEQPHVKAASGEDDDWHWEIELAVDYEWREQLIAELGGRPFGFMQLINAAREKSHYWGDIAEDVAAIDIWIGPADCLGKGYGTQMMKLAFERCFADPTISRIYIDPLVSNHRAHRFYERLGFRFLEERDFDGDRCRVYELTRADWERGKGERGSRG